MKNWEKQVKICFLYFECLICRLSFKRLIVECKLLGNKATRRNARDTPVTSTPLSASTYKNSNTSRVLNVNFADDADTARMKKNETRENTLKRAISNFERDKIKYKDQIETAQKALDEHYLDMINEYAPLPKIARFD